MFDVKIYGSGLMLMLLLILCFKANYNRKILGKISYLLFKDNIHGYISIYWFKVNLT
jgi:hypothetical protein